jgi:hypothetical protein
MIVSPAASADVLEPSITPDAPPAPAWDTCLYQRKPGKVIVVDIVGRTDALGTVGPYAN